MVDLYGLAGVGFIIGSIGLLCRDMSGEYLNTGGSEAKGEGY